MGKSLQLKHDARGAESLPFSQQLDHIFVYQTLMLRKSFQLWKYTLMLKSNLC